MLSETVITMRQCIGYIAQWLERLPADQQVPGSNPGVPSLDFLLLHIPSYDVTNQGALEFAFPLHFKFSMPIWNFGLLRRHSLTAYILQNLSFRRGFATDFVRSHMLVLECPLFWRWNKQIRCSNCACKAFKSLQHLLLLLAFVA